MLGSEDGNQFSLDNYCNYLQEHGQYFPAEVAPLLFLPHLQINPTASYGTYDSTPIQSIISSNSPHDLDNDQLQNFYSPMTNSPPSSGYFESSDQSNLQYSNSTSMESMNRAACRYSPEEKKERIERYRSKRNLRNFSKKIQYECRKTLAERRARVRGRFARNDDQIEMKRLVPPHIDQTQSSSWDHNNNNNTYDILINNDEDDHNWISVLYTLSS